MGAGLEVKRTLDAAKCLYILNHEDILDTITEDGATINDLMPDVIKEIWLEITVDDELIGVCCIHAKYAKTCQCHIQILKEHRKENSALAGEAILKWIKENTGFKVILTEVPAIYQNVINYLKSFDFRLSGVIEKSFYKNGKLIDMVILQKGG